MVGQETVGKGIGYQMDVFCVQPQEIMIIAFMSEQRFAIVTAVKDVVVLVTL